MFFLVLDKMILSEKFTCTYSLLQNASSTIIITYYNIVVDYTVSWR